MPPMLQALVHRLVRWKVLPPSMAPDSAIINIYDQVSSVSQSALTALQHWLVVYVCPSSLPQQ